MWVKIYSYMINISKHIISFQYTVSRLSAPQGQYTSKETWKKLLMNPNFIYTIQIERIRQKIRKKERKERETGCLLLLDFSLREGFKDSIHFFCHCSQCKLKLLLRMRQRQRKSVVRIPIYDLSVCLCLHVYLGLNHARSLISQVFQSSSNINLFSTYKETKSIKYINTQHTEYMCCFNLE